MKSVFTLLLCCLLLAGCQSKPADSSAAAPASSAPEAVASVPETTEFSETAPQTEAPDVQPPVSMVWNWVDGLPFCLSSGAGAWQCDLTVDARGSFQGTYADSNPGETGEGYPEGTLYLSRFSGSFSEPVWDGPGAYLFRVDRLQDLQPLGEQIQDGVMHRYVHADQMEGDAFFLYLPGKQVSELPENARRWLSLQDAGRHRLTRYLIYNYQEGLAFVSDPASPWLAGQNLLRMTQEEAEFLDEAAHNPGLSQTDLNEISESVYECWDLALNDLYAMLRDSLSSEDMAIWQDAQLLWIEQKEAAARAHADEAGGGSMAPMFYYETAVTYTRDRAYLLAEALPQD